MENAVNISKPTGCFEIQKIVGISTIHGNCRSYKVQWAPSWISGAHLIGCENLIEQYKSEHTEGEVHIKIELPDGHNLKEIENHLGIVEVETGVSCLQDTSGVTDLEIDKETSSSHDLHNSSVLIQDIKEGFQYDVSNNANSEFDQNHTDNDSNVEVKVKSLDCVIQQIATRNYNQYAGRRTLHPDFQQVEINAANEMEVEVNEQEVFSSNPAESIIPGDDSNFPLQDFKNFNHPKREVEININKYFGKNKVNREKCRIETTNLLNIGEPSTPSKSYPVKTISQRNIEASEIFHCHNCNKVFSDDVTLEQHTKLHNCIYQCIICSKVFELEDKLKKHELKVHSTCHICKLEFSDMQKLKVHIEAHKTVKSDSLECSYCGKRWSRYSHLKVHERVHTGERPFKCNICHKGFTINSHLKRHVKTQHLKYNPS